MVTWSARYSPSQACDSGVAAPVASQDRAASDGADASDASDSAESADSADGPASSEEKARTASTLRILHLRHGRSHPHSCSLDVGFCGRHPARVSRRLRYDRRLGGRGCAGSRIPRYPLRDGVVLVGRDYRPGSRLHVNHGTSPPRTSHVLPGHTPIRSYRQRGRYHPGSSTRRSSSAPNTPTSGSRIESRLWDNQWVTGNMMAAARWAQSAYGASIVQNIRTTTTSR